MSRHERWGSLCDFCEESWPCETVTLRDENAKRREQADALAAALADARRWMMATNDYESLSPAGHSLTRDAISTADAALRAYREATQ